MYVDVMLADYPWVEVERSMQREREYWEYYHLPSARPYLSYTRSPSSQQREADVSSRCLRDVELFVAIN